MLQTDTYAVSLHKPHADTQGFLNDYIWLAGLSTITGGAGADVLTGGDGADVFVQVLGDSVARTAENFTEADINNGETITFGNGVDIITDFNTATDTIDTVTADNLTTFADGSDVQALAVDLNFAIVGNFNAGTGVFTIAGDGKDTLVLVDALAADFTADTQTSMMVLQGVTDLAAANFV